MFLVCSFICVVFLCLFIIITIFLLTVFEVSFPGFNVEFFLPFGFFPPKVGLVVCINFMYGEVSAEFLFVFPLMGKAK